MTELAELVETGLRIRQAELVGVSYPERTIEMIVIPYEQEALVPHPSKPTMVTEIVSRGAFDGIEHRPGRIRVNRDHDRQRACGKAISFHPSRREGLIAKVRLSPTPLGDETLELAADGVLDASAGFRPKHENGHPGEVWESPSRCRIRKGWLVHIALTPEPAYEGAKVLAVRQAEPAVAVAEPVALPNLEAWRLEQLRQQIARLDARWGVR
jgi:HK97 family phage prohead protease